MYRVLFLDIYLTHWVDEYAVGSNVEITCVAEGFNKLTDIAIHREDTTLASITEGLAPQVSNVTIVTSNITETEGTLVIQLISIQCSDKGRYTCFSSGEGKMKNDTLKLNVTDC